MRIELRHLRYAVAVAEEGHITRAAARLGIQQPPLSQQIRALEEAVGVQLFHRSARGVESTAAGLALVDRARRILHSVDEAVEAARKTARGEGGRLALGFTSSAAFHPFVTTAVRAFRDAAPDVALSLDDASTAELIDALVAGRLDVAFVRSPVAMRDGLSLVHLRDEAMLVAVNDRHPLASTRHPIALAALAQEPFILYRRPAGAGLYDGIIAACRAAGFSPHVAHEATRLVSTLSFVATGFGVSIIPESIARLETSGIAYLRLDGSVPLTAPLALATKAAALDGPVARFVRLVERQLRLT